MLYQRLVTAGQAVERKEVRDAWCERCAWPGLDGSFNIVQAVVVLEQLRDPKIAFNVFIGACAAHYPPALAKAYKEHGWKVRWTTR